LQEAVLISFGMLLLHPGPTASQVILDCVCHRRPTRPDSPDQLM
jgi:hypothetical protein